MDHENDQQAEDLPLEERKERLEHKEALEDLRNLFVTLSGTRFIKYLLKNLNVGEIPEQGIEGNQLFEQLGFLRAGNAIYKLACEANFEQTALLVAQIEKEKYDAIYLEALAARQGHRDTSSR